MDISDAFDEISNWEEQLLIEGEELGMEKGRELGIEEGRELGCACTPRLHPLSMKTASD